MKLIIHQMRLLLKKPNEQSNQPTNYVNEENQNNNVEQKTFENVTGNCQQAISEVTFPKYESDGTKTDVHVSDLLKEHLDTTDLSGEKDNEAKTLTFKDVLLKDVYLNSDYLNGKSEAGISFYNMVNYFTDVKQIKQILDANPGYTVIDSAGNKVDGAYIDELLGLINQIINFDTGTNLKYDKNSTYDSAEFAQNSKLGGTDVIATSNEGNVTLKFHIDSHGWWGYDLGADDSITGLVMGFDQDAIDADHKEHEGPLTRAYANFFVIDMQITRWLNFIIITLKSQYRILEKHEISCKKIGVSAIICTKILSSTSETPLFCPKLGKKTPFFQILSKDQNLRPKLIIMLW